jgi:hypothetical protein
VTVSFHFLLDDERTTLTPTSSEYEFNICGYVHRSMNQQEKTNKVIEFIIPKFQHTAHHQELQTVFSASGLYTHVVTGRCPGWTTELLMTSGTPLETC